ncbi:ABC transporter permease [Brucella cytisi]|uniref:ABC transporter permease n=1 Tax=Brucella cytisi TaxID=407152 RepID=UPI0035DB197E
MDFTWLDRFLPVLQTGLINTIKLTVYSGVIGFALANVVGLFRISKNPILAWGSLVFTSVIRGTPLLVQIFIFYYGLGELFGSSAWLKQSFLWPYMRDGFGYVVIALSISVAAYLGEIMRSAFLSVPVGELEAGKAFGLAPSELFLRILYPRAIQQVVPTLTGETVLHMKSTALASTVAVVELLGAANRVRQTTFLVYEPLLLIGAIYIVLTLLIEGCGRFVERRQRGRR